MAGRAQPSSRSSPVAGATPRGLVRLAVVVLLDGCALWAAIWLVASGAWLLLIFLGLGTLGLNVAVLSRRAYPLRYLLPGLFFMAMMVVYPIGYTVFVAFTDYGTGHVLTKGQAIAQFEARFYEPSGAPRYPFTAFQDPDRKSTRLN